MQFIGIIPARFQSTRFPGKPLALIQGKPMIQWVVEQAQKELEQVFVATDHTGIARVVEAFGGKYVMTSPEHPSGTDRCAEAARILSKTIDFDVVINVQGDEPFIRKEQIRLLKDCFTPAVQIATLMKAVTDPSELENPNKPKVVVDQAQMALYFSRSVIPYCRGKEKETWAGSHPYWTHIGMYGYRKEILQELTKLPPGSLETAESLEQLRWLEHGYRIKTAVTHSASYGIDTPEDLEYVLKHFQELNVSL